MQKVQYERFVLGDLGTNVYRVFNENTEIVIDPADSKILKHLKKNADAVLLTHCHYDHISGLSSFEKDIPCYISEDELEFLKRGGMLYEDSSIDHSRFKAEYILKGKEGTIDINGIKIEYFLFPGHTPGSLVYKIDDKLFCGDLVFKGSIGRCDLPDGDEAEMSGSLKSFFRIFTDEMIILPGHSEITTVKNEKENNYLVKEYMNGNFI